MSYFALIVIFLTTVLGIAGKTWDPKARGVHRLTAKGLVVLILALGSLIVGVIDVRNKDLQLLDVARIRDIANRQVLDGVNYLVRHVIAEQFESMDNRELFSKIESPANLVSVGQECLVNFSGGSIGDGHGGVGGFFDHQWQLYAFNVEHGRKLLEDVVFKYGAFIDPALIVRINDVVHDEFFVNDFTLNRSIVFYLEIAEKESRESMSCSGSGTLGLYYFKAVYIKGKERPPDYQRFLRFMGKLRSLVDNSSEGNKIYVFPREAR